MESYALPFRSLARVAGWFARAREIRLLNVVASAELREGAVDVVAAQEYHADNASPFVRCDTAYTADDGGWVARATEVTEQHSRRRELLAKSGIDLSPLPRVSVAPGRDALGVFAETLAATMRASCAPLSGLIVVLAPIEIEDPHAYDVQVRSLIESPRLADVRWIQVDVEHSSVGGIVEKMGNAALACDVRVSETLVSRDLDRKIAGSIRASADAPGAAQMGAAWPSALPPRGVAPSAEERANALTAAGVPPALTNPRIPQLRPLVLLAAAAMRRGSPLEAVRHQSNAVVLAKEVGLEREAAVLELMLATFVVHAGDRARATRIYTAVAARAEEKEWFDLAAQAIMARAALRLLDRERDPASALYAQAGAIAVRGDETAIAIEAFRMAGQLRAEASDEQQAIQLWSRAVELAGPMTLTDAGQSSAPLAARSLASVLRRRGMQAQAKALEEQAVRMETATGGAQTGEQPA